MVIELAAVSALAFLAAAIHASVGFGFALIFVPSATLIVGPEASVAAMLIAVPLVGSVLYGIDRPRTPLWDAVPIAGVSVLSLPVGLWLLTHADDDLLRLLVGLAVAIAVIIDRWSGDRSEIERGRSSFARITISGLASGVMRGATGIGGPPYVLYYRWLGGAGWQFRSRLFSSSAMSGIASLCIAWFSGIFDSNTVPIVLVSFPTTAIGISVGIWARPSISEHRLQTISVLLLVATALLAMTTAISALV